MCEAYISWQERGTRSLPNQGLHLFRVGIERRKDLRSTNSTSLNLIQTQLATFPYPIVYEFYIFIRPHHINIKLGLIYKVLDLRALSLQYYAHCLELYNMKSLLKLEIGGCHPTFIISCYLPCCLNPGPNLFPNCIQEL